MTARSIATTLCSLALTTAFLAAAPGCASLQAQLNRKLLDYATVEQGARITVPGTNDGFSAQNLIDGVTKVRAWNGDAGWEFSFRRTRYYYSERVFRPYRVGSIRENMDRGSAWVLIEFPHVRRINRIAVHTLNTIDMPSPGIISGLVQVRTPADTQTLGRRSGRSRRATLSCWASRPPRPAQRRRSASTRWKPMPCAW